MVAGGLWLTLCDPNQLENAILNLAINARDAMPDGGRLIIETANSYLDDAYAAREIGVRAGQYVCICVTDTGTGMPPDVIEKAFDPFFTTKPIGQGTGLGLSMIYGFAKQSEGNVKIYSETGKGTSVKLYLPRYSGEVEEPGEGTARRLAPSTARRFLWSRTTTPSALWLSRCWASLAMRRGRHLTDLAGLRILESNARIDLLVTDVGLPGLNGRQLADQARIGRPEPESAVHDRLRGERRVRGWPS